MRVVKYPLVPQQEPFNIQLGKRAQEDALNGVHFPSRPKRLGRTSNLKIRRESPTQSSSTLSTENERSSDYHCKSKRKGVDFQHQPSSLKGTYRVSKGGIGCCTKYIIPNACVPPKTNHPTLHIHRQKNPPSKTFKVVFKFYRTSKFYQIYHFIFILAQK